MGFDGPKAVKGAAASDPVFDAVMARPDRASRPLAGFTRADQVEVLPVDWLVEKWLARDTLAAWIGPSGSCKTFAVVDVACCTATETPFHGCKVKRGAVFMLAGEGRSGLRKRIEGWSAHHGVSIDGAPLYLGQLPRLDIHATGKIITEIEQMADEMFFSEGSPEPALIVIDTVARAMVGDENSAEAMGALVEAADWLRERWPGCTVLLVHHTGHANGGRARGSSALYAALDSEALMKPLRCGDVQLHATKCKDWGTPMPLQFRRHEVSIEVPGTGQATSTLVLVNTQMTQGIDRSAEVRELQAAGKSIRTIATETGLSKSMVERLLKDTKASKPVWLAEFDE